MAQGKKHGGRGDRRQTAQRRAPMFMCVGYVFIRERRARGPQTAGKAQGVQAKHARSRGCRPPAQRSVPGAHGGGVKYGC